MQTACYIKSGLAHVYSNKFKPHKFMTQSYWYSTTKGNLKRTQLQRNVLDLGLRKTAVACPIRASTKVIGQEVEMCAQHNPIQVHIATE